MPTAVVLLDKYNK